MELNIQRLTDLMAREYIIEFLEGYHLLTIDATISPEKIDEYTMIIRQIDLEKDSGYDLFLMHAAMVYLAVCVHNSSENISSLKIVFNLRDKDLLWMTSIDDLINEVKKINNEESYFIPYHNVVLHYFILYLPIKIRTYLYKSAKRERLYDKEIRNEIAIMVYKTLQNFKNRLAKRGNEYVKDDYEKIVLESRKELTRMLTEMPTSTLVKPDIAMNMEASGNVDFQYLSPLYHLAIPNLNKKDRKPREIALFPLFKFMLKDRYWLSIEEFSDSNKLDKKGNPIGLYGGSYERYQKSLMKSFIDRN